MTKTTPSTSEVRRIAAEYGLECKAQNRRPSLAEMSRRLGRPSQWLSAQQTLGAEIARAETNKVWRELEVQPVTVPECNADDELPPPPMPDNPLAGDALYQVLIHPDRLRQFCNLAETWGVATAFRYAEQSWSRAHAPKSTTQDAA